MARSASTDPMNQFPTNLVFGAILFLWNRLMGGLQLDVKNAKMVGSVSAPALWLELAVKNPIGEAGYVDTFEFALIEPVANSGRVEIREAGYPRKVNRPLNIPARGALTVDAVVHFQCSLPGANGQFAAKGAALGRKGFRKRWVRIKGDYEINPD